MGELSADKMRGRGWALRALDLVLLAIMLSSQGGIT